MRREAIGPAAIRSSWPACAATSAITCQPGRTPVPGPDGCGRPIAVRRRWRRPSGCVSVPSFSGYASAGKTTSAYSRIVSVITDSWAITVCAVPSAAFHSPRSGCVRSGSACSR